MNEKDLIRAERAEYARNYRKKNPEKVKAAQERYWQRRAERLAAEMAKEAVPDGG